MVEDGRDSADKYSLRGRVFARIRDDILDGKYQENEELKESAIGKELGVSRTPVREALRQLELEGLVTIIPNKGAYVTGITERDINDIYAIRSYLEGLCCRWACEKITPEQLTELDEIIYLAKFHADKKNTEQLVELDDKFHNIIYEASGSKMLRRVLTDFHSYVHRIRTHTLSSTTRSRDCISEHAAIVEAFRSGNPDRAEELAHEHIQNSLDNITRKGIKNILSGNVPGE
ncbi:GntR family transcriptional regulator [Anaerolentibacter hominis]|uniref:GntR family transcriptional regulator n=1 Tax=Anaerolentibacter hominis TaxID=3079009 RepID=UPI0031B89F8F